MQEVVYKDAKVSLGPGHGVGTVSKVSARFASLGDQLLTE